jgi:hypothetical protein
MKGINPKYLEKLDDGQRRFILTGPGKFFADSFLFIPAEHAFVLGPTGSGKTNKNHNLVNWLKHTEVILWISASKDQDIVPLFFMGLPVNIIIPKYAGIEITISGKPADNIVYSIVDDPSDVFYAIKNDHINILEVRNAFWDRGKLLDWMIKLFQLIAEWTRNGLMPTLEPLHSHTRKSKISVFIDESQWLIAGSKVTNDPKRVKATEIISENALEIRTYGWRIIISGQGFTNAPPIMRENLACAFLCSGADVKDPPKLRVHCNPTVPGWRRSSQFHRNECKFIDREGRSSPSDRPLPIPLYPKDEYDRDLASKIKIAYARTYHDRPPATEEIDTECFPENNRYSYLMEPPEKEERNHINKFQYDGEHLED